MRMTALCLLLAGCTATGTVQVFIAAEDTIPDGLRPGSDEEDIRDGWAVEYHKFLVAIGNFRARRSGSDETLRDPKVYVLDMKNLPAQGFVLTRFAGVAAERWDKVGFDMPNASMETLSAPGDEDDDYQRMTQNGYSLYFEATLEKADGQSCLPTAPTNCVPRPSLTIRWGVPAGTAFDDCAPPVGDAGFAVPTGGTVQVKPTVHGDHWFFNNLTQGAEITERLAQWMVDCDLDRDGETTVSELKQVQAADVFTPAKGYNLTGALVPIHTAYDYLEAQARTLGDFQGEGECPSRHTL